MIKKYIEIKGSIKIGQNEINEKLSKVALQDQ
jgi:hypothetical protein